MWKGWVLIFKVKVTVRVQILKEYLSRRYLLNHLTFRHETWYDGASWWCIILTWRVMQKGWVPSFKVKVTVGLRSSRKNLESWNLYNQTWYSGGSSRASVAWQFSIAVLKVTVMVQILREYLSWQYFMNHFTFHKLMKLGMLVVWWTPGEARGFLMSPPCLESQGCQFDPTVLYILSCSSA